MILASGGRIRRSRRACRGRILRRAWSGCVSVFVDESGAAARFHDPKVTPMRLRRRAGSLRCLLVERAVGSVGVVVLDVVNDESLQLVLVPDDVCGATLRVARGVLGG